MSTSIHIVDKNVWRNLSQQRLTATIGMMFKTLHNMTPEYLQSRFVSRNDMIAYRLRIL